MIQYSNLNKYTILEKSSLFELIKKINLNGKKFAIAIDEKNKISGIFTDGDIRRLLLKKIDLNEKIKFFCKKKFTYIYQNSLKNKNPSFKNTEQIPVVDRSKKLKGILFKDSSNRSKFNNSIFILAGGLGTRMGKITKKIPKPMLKINKKPILENIILSFKKKGFENFIISTNYLAKKITNYFGDGSLLDVNIKYTKEKIFLGTAGSLNLIDKKEVVEDIFVTNGDVYGNLDYSNMLNIHKKKTNDLTICARLHVYDLPYGLIADKKKDSFLNEKPKLTYLINSGIYIIKKKLLKYIKKNTYLDMNDLLNNLKRRNYKIGIYTIYEPLYDIGNMKQYNEVKKIFKKKY